MKKVTCVAPSNIATIKYWGKRDEELILPVNDSLSVTLSVELMRAKTTIAISPAFTKNRIWLNGVEESFEQNKRLMNCIEEIRNRSRASGDGQSNGEYDWKIHICSENNFPTAAGLASSAAGYACLVYALTRLYNIQDDVTSLARRGSGSACRSMYGGFVMWQKGERADGTDSIAIQVAPETHWPELRALILIVRSEKKTTSSSAGMTRSCATSELLETRAQNIVPKRIAAMKQAILDKDFKTFAEITIKDSNQFHAICLDTYPPAVYMSDTSHTIAALVHAFNETCASPQIAYTFDAGANACLFFEKKNAPVIMALFNYYFPKSGDNFRGETVDEVSLSDEVVRSITLPVQATGLIKGMIYSDVGSGPKVLDEIEALLGEDGLPVPNPCITLE